MIVASKVVLPTPLRPMTDRVSLAPRPRRMSSSTTVSPYPARSLSSSSARSAMTPPSARSSVTFLAEIDGPHLHVIHDLFRRALRENRALHQYRDFPGKAEHDVHVMLDDQHRNVGVERGHHVEDEMTF